MNALTTVRYIDANKLMSDLCLRSCHNREHRCDNDSAANEDLAIVEMIKEMPVVDAVPVVRCKECKHRGDSDRCPLKHLAYTTDEGYFFADYTLDDSFCSFGKKKDGGASDG